MKITITKGTGTGHTLLSSFDTALKNCGVANYNIIALSSIIPPNTVIVREKYVTPESEWGHRLYVVKADKRSDVKGEVIGTGIGWYKVGDKGMFVEHEEHGESEEEVTKLLTDHITGSLQDLCKNRGIVWEDNNFDMELNVATVGDLPTTTLVLAVYKAEGWE